MSKNPPSDKLDPLHIKGTKHGIKINSKGEIKIPDDLYEKHRPEDWAKGIERQVDMHQAKFAASVLHSIEDDIVDHFKKHKKASEVKGKVVLAYKGNNLTLRVARDKTFSMEAAPDKKAFATISISRTLKAATKPAKDHLCEIAKKRKI